MHSIEKNCLIEFFDSINEYFEYVVMRNANELPFDNYSNDVDILINNVEYSNFEKNMTSIFRKHGFERVERTSHHGIECYTFYNIKHEKPFSLKIDLFFNIEGGGVLYYSFEDVIKFKSKNENGIYIFSSKVEAYITALKTLAAGGKLKDKYLYDFLENTIEKNHELVLQCPSSTLLSYLNNICKTKNNIKNVSRGKVVLETLQSNIKDNAIASLKRLTYHYKTKILRSFNKRFMMVFVGPDGSGKTTLINKTIDDSKIIFRSQPERFVIIHHRPHLFPNIGQIFKRKLTEKEDFDLNFNPHSSKSSNIFISLFKILYYISDYILGYFFKIIPLQCRNKFIIFDRYYYDFIVDQKRSALHIPKNISIQLFKFFIPKPNKVFYIYVDALKAHERKKELPVEAIEAINNGYSLLTEEFNNFVIIPNDDLELAYNEVLKNIILVITNNINTLIYKIEP